MSEEYKRLAELGQEFHAARSSKKLTIQKVSNITKIKKSYLEAIEAGNTSMIPYRTYLLGYVRSYAELLELDVKSILEGYKKALKEETGGGDSIDNYVKACNINSRGTAMKLPTKKFLLFTLLIIIFIGYLSFYYNY